MKKIILVSLSLLCLGAFAAQAQEAFPFVAKVTATTANLRAGQNTNFESLGQLKSGDEVIVVEASYDWRKIKLPVSAKAYVSASYIKDLGDGTGEVIGNRLNIRASALPTSSIIGQLKKGESVRIVEKKADWFRIEPPDQSFGWVAKDFLQFKSVDIPPARTIASPLGSVSVKPVESKTPFPELPAAVISLSGLVEDLGDKAVSPDIRHFLKSDGKVYALQGYRHILDGFLNQKVKVEGQIKPNFKSENPVVLVTKITLVL